MKFKKHETYVLTLTKEEVEILEEAIGGTSTNSRIESGMTQRGSYLMEKLYTQVNNILQQK